MSSDDVRVRLSAEGERQIADSMARALRATQSSTKGMSRAVEGVNKSLGSMRALFGQVAAAASVGALVAFARSASETADKVGKMSQAVGASVKNFSAIRASALTADVGLDELGQGLQKLNRVATDAVAGNDKARDSFKALGISIEQIRGKDAAERFALIAQQFSKLQDSPEKAALAFEFFGRQAGALIPLLNDLGEVGLAGATQRAEELGLILSENTARAAQALNDDFAILNAQVQALGAQFIEGLAPALHVALTGVSSDFTNASDAAKEFGKAVGSTVGFAIVFVTDLIDRLGTSVAKIGNALGGLSSSIGALFRGKFGLEGVREALLIERETSARSNEIEADFQRRHEERLQRIEELGRAAVVQAESLPALRSGTRDIEAPVIPEREKKKGGKSDEQVKAEQAIAAFQGAQNVLEFERARIQEQVNAGVLSQVEAEQQLADVERERLELLQSLAAAALAAAQATGDPAAIERAQELTRSVELLGISVAATGDILRKLGATAKDVAVGALTEFFTTGIREAKNFGSAVVELTLTVVDALQQILAQELAVQAVRAFSRAFGLPFARGGEVKGYAIGGPIQGPGSGTSDSIPALLSRGEFVVRAAVVQRPGVLDHLRSLNAGGGTPTVSASRTPRFASGGLVAGPPESRLSANLTLGLADGLVLREISSPAGQRAVINVVAKNPRGTRSALGGV